MRPSSVLVCSVVLLAATGTMRSQANWNGLAAPGYTYCYVRDPCGLGCEDWLLALDADCSRTCDILGENPNYPCGAGVLSDVAAARSWSVSGEDRDHSLEPFFVSMAALGQRSGPATFLVDGTKSQRGDALLEVAVFRYAGDPSAFDGLAPGSVADLVDWGVITEDDVLLAKSTSELGETFSFEIDVTGLADEEIVLMATGAAIVPPHVVPATRPVGVALLALVVLALGSGAVLKRRRASARGRVPRLSRRSRSRWSR